MASVWGELQRRNVVKVAVAYAIVAWLLIQIIVSVEEPLNLPDWTDTFIIILLLVGFVVSLILAWAYELTPDGVQKTKSVPLPDSITNVAGRKLDFAIIALLVLAVGFMFVDNYVLVERPPFAGAEVDPASLDSAADTPPAATAVQPAPPTVAEEQRDVLPNSVAVLPFTNLSPNPDDAYFAAGVHEEVLNQLVKIRDLRVIARTSVLRYANSPPPIPEIAAELQVQVVMEGSVRYAGDQVRVTAQLIDGDTNTHLWSEVYERNLVDIFAIQADIATRIAMALEAELLPAEQASIEKPPTDSVDAYAFFLRGLTSTVISPQTRPDASVAFQDYMDQAIALDPEFALAYAYKGLDYATWPTRTNRLDAEVTREEANRLAQEHAQIALELDPNVGMAHAVIAQWHRFNRRWPEAREAFARALESSPNDFRILGQYATFNAVLGAREETESTLQRYLEINPQNIGLQEDARWVLGDYAAGTLLSVDLINTAPGAAVGYLYSGFFNSRLGKDEAALESLRLYESLRQDDTQTPAWHLAEAAYAYSLIGMPAEAQRYLEELEVMSEDYDVGPGNWAFANLAIGDYDRALEWLTEAADNWIADGGWRNLELLATNRWNDPILNLPEFVAVRERLGFTE
jgi:TolB-like protein